MGSEDKKQEVSPTDVVVLKHGVEDSVQADMKKEQAELKKVRGVMFLDKLNCEKILAEEKPKLAKAEADRKKYMAMLNKEGQAAINKLKFTADVKALRDLLGKFGVKFVKHSIEFVGVDAKKQVVHYQHKVRQKNPKDRYGDRTLEGAKELPFAAAMKDTAAKLKAAEDEVKRSQQAMTDAQAKLRDRANRMADVEGAMALRAMGAEEQAEVKKLYGDLQGGLSVKQLMAGTKKDAKK
jgi:hypothetical protein